MIVLLALTLVLFAHIHYTDVRFRLVYARDLWVLVALRVLVFVVVVLAQEAFGASSVLGLAEEQWGVKSLVLSAAAGIIVFCVVQGIAVIANRLFNKYGAKDESIGMGDLKLYFVCALFAGPQGVFVMLVLSALVGVIIALVFKVAWGKRTFPFAPAIVWSTFAVMLAEVVGLL